MCSAPGDGSPPSTISKIAGITMAAAARKSIERLHVAAVGLNVCRSRFQPPTSIAAPSTSRTLPEDRADDRGLHDLVEALAEREQGDDQLGRVAEGHVEQAADPGPDRSASSSMASPIRAAVGTMPMAEVPKMSPASALARSRMIASGMNGTSR